MYRILFIFLILFSFPTWAQTQGTGGNVYVSAGCNTYLNLRDKVLILLYPEKYKDRYIKTTPVNLDTTHIYDRLRNLVLMDHIEKMNNLSSHDEIIEACGKDKYDQALKDNPWFTQLTFEEKRQIYQYMQDMYMILKAQSVNGCDKTDSNEFNKYLVLYELWFMPELEKYNKENSKDKINTPVREIDLNPPGQGMKG